MHLGWGGDRSLVSWALLIRQEGAKMMIGQLNEALPAGTPMRIEAILVPDLRTFVLCGRSSIVETKYDVDSAGTVVDAQWLVASFYASLLTSF